MPDKPRKPAPLGDTLLSLDVLGWTLRLCPLPSPDDAGEAKFAALLYYCGHALAAGQQKIAPSFDFPTLRTIAQHRALELAVEIEAARAEAVSRLTGRRWLVVVREAADETKTVAVVNEAGFEDLWFAAHNARTPLPIVEAVFDAGERIQPSEASDLP